MNESTTTRESAGEIEQIVKPQQTTLGSLSVASGSFVVLAAGQSAEDEAVVYPSYAIASVEAHLRSMLAIEAACTAELAGEYAAKLALSRKACADDLEAWAQHGFVGDTEPEFTAALLATCHSTAIWIRPSPSAPP